MQLQRLVRSRRKSGEAFKLAQVFGIKLPTLVVSDGPDGPDSFAPD
jgi:hypothetical protein